MTQHNDLWVEKYRPSALDEYIFHDPADEEAIKSYITAKKFPHLLLSGVRGAGKTSLARLLISLCEVNEADVLEINASAKRGIDTFRDEIETFAGSMAFGRFKVVYLEEGDKLTPDAQDALKSFMEDKSEYVRFIMTCNTVSKVKDAIRSRFQEMTFKHVDADDMAIFLVKILTAEKVQADINVVDAYVAAYKPDIRKMVNEAQRNSVTGTLIPPKSLGEGGDYQDKLLELIASGDWQRARALVCSSTSSSDWEGVYRFLYQNIGKVPKFRVKQAWDSAILIIAERLYRHAYVSDAEINGAAMFVELSNI